jgi:hypothetical protein
MPQVYDINTSGDTDGITPHGRTYVPLRYTETEADALRVGLFLLLSTQLGSYKLDKKFGLNIHMLLDPETSDAERSAIVAEACMSFPGVTGVSEGPTVTTEGGTATINVKLDTIHGPVALVV